MSFNVPASNEDTCALVPNAMGEYLSGCRLGLKTFPYLYDLLGMAKL